MPRWLTAIILSLSLTSGPALASAVLIEDGDATVTVPQFRAELEQLAPAERADVLRNARTARAFAERLLAREKMLREAEAQGLDQTPRIAARLEQMRRDLLLQALVESHVAAQPSAQLESLAEEFYRANPDRFREPEQIRIAQIFLPVTDTAERETARAKAEELHAQLQEGADFAELARTHSVGPNAANGGELDSWLVQGRGNNPVLDTAFDLPREGAISDLIVEDHGFRILKLLERRDSEVLPFEVVKERILQRLRRRFRDQLRDAYVASFGPGEDAVIHEDVLRGLVRSR